MAETNEGGYDFAVLLAAMRKSLQVAGAPPTKCGKRYVPPCADDDASPTDHDNASWAGDIADNLEALSSDLRSKQKPAAAAFVLRLAATWNPGNSPETYDLHTETPPRAMYQSVSSSVCFSELQVQWEGYHLWISECCHDAHISSSRSATVSLNDRKVCTYAAFEKHNHAAWGGGELKQEELIIRWSELETVLAHLRGLDCLGPLSADLASAEMDSEVLLRLAVCLLPAGNFNHDLKDKISNALSAQPKPSVQKVVLCNKAGNPSRTCWLGTDPYTSEDWEGLREDSEDEEDEEPLPELMLQPPRKPVSVQENMQHAMMVHTFNEDR
mmetsp:Transcript_29569/g.68523  ORF Transcript_29569/g.68523 Transcript_29569/m.68523 type:complete len:327 (+) Transcript_29569:61-1041(+)